MEEIRKEIRTYILDSHWSQQECDLEDNHSLMELGVLDSLGLLQMVSFIEERFSIDIGHHLSAENLDSIARVTALVQRRLAAKGNVQPMEYDAELAL